MNLYYVNLPCMPRQARIDAPGAFHHIICRGLERRDIFLDDEDRDSFVSRLASVLDKTSTRCYAWALIPNHFHLLLQTGSVPIATVMRQLLTGYAVVFNLRHRRSGHLFQNRYKSILCQEEPYLLELVRYIHLNPLRAGLVGSLDELNSYRYSGHSRLLCCAPEQWQAVDDVLRRFDCPHSKARQKYQAFIEDGVHAGKRTDLTGGGLIRSAGGWEAVTAARGAGMFLKSDERILGESAFVEEVLKAAEEEVGRREMYRLNGIDLERLVSLVAELFGMDTAEVWKEGKMASRVQPRSLLCYWATRELGLTATAIGAKLNLSQSAISRAAQRGEQLARERDWQLQSIINA